MFTNKSNAWRTLVVRSVAFFLLSLVVMSLMRAGFFVAHRSPDTSWTDFLPAVLMGIRVDAKWLALLFLPAYISLFCGYWWSVFRKLAVVFGIIGYGIAVTLGVINFGFFGFFGTPINTFIFGFIQDDTTAIIKTLLKDWPVLTYLGVWLALIAVPVLLAKCFKSNNPEKVSRRAYAVMFVLSAVLTGVLIRGSLGTFPLRQQNYDISPNHFINQTVPNGPSLFYEAIKARKALVLKGGAIAAMKDMGFASTEEATDILKALRVPVAATPAPAEKPHIVLTVMESMGRDAFESHHPETNNTLGMLADEIKDAVYFRQGLSVAHSTYPTLEGLLFDTPTVPITQTQYGRKTFDFSEILPFKAAGYHTVFMTAGTEAWRHLDTNLPLQGFDEVVGANKIHAQFPESEFDTWGVGDEWMFKMAQMRLAEADRKGEKLMLVLLSVTNHPPHRVPDGVQTKPVDPFALPDFIQDEKQASKAEVLQTYQYSANALGRFIKHTRSQPFGHRTLITATGDHNMRIQYKPNGYWHHSHGVPILFWLPDSMKSLSQNADTTRWVSHRDIFPTIHGLVFGTQPQLFEGRNLFAKDPFDLALSYEGLGRHGFAVGNWGAVSLDGQNAFTCYRWNGDQLVPATPCTDTMQKMGNAARAQRALADFTVRSGLLKKDR